MLRATISVATDDLLHGGDSLHWEKMQWLNKHYRLGKFSQGDGRFVGKEIRCQPDGSILMNQPLYTKEKIKEIHMTKERKGRKLTLCNKEEITQLRGLLGSLAWLSKETRPDLADALCSGPPRGKCTGTGSFEDPGDWHPDPTDTTRTTSGGYNH